MAIDARSEREHPLGTLDLTRDRRYVDGNVAHHPGDVMVGIPLVERAKSAPVREDAVVDGRGATRGEAAERLVVERLRAVLGPPIRVFDNVTWLARDHGYERQGEADVVIADPARGILVIEVKAGEIRRDKTGRWHAGRPLPRSPFEQASDSRFALVDKLYEIPAWPAGLKPINGHAVAFPDVDLDSMHGRLGLLGPDVDVELIADQSSFVDDEAGRRELVAFVDRAFEVWSGKAGESAPGRAGVDVLVSLLEAPFELRPMLRNEIAGGEGTVLRLTTGQVATLNLLRGIRRAAIVGGAGTGKTLLALEKARRLAREGFRTLLVCFNAPLSRMLAEDSEDVMRETGLLDVKTFHQLCEDLGREAGVLGDRPVPVPQDWWDRTLPGALDDAIGTLGPRYHAIVVDEGQDFADVWLLSLDGLLIGGHEDVLYVFHDPAQAIYREDAVAGLGLPEIPLEMNCRNAQPIHELVARFAGPGMAPMALRDDGRPPEFIEAEGAAGTVAALRGVLHRLRVDEDVPPWQIAVLTGAKLESSAVWGVPGRRYGNEVLGNAAVDDAGHNIGLAAHLVPQLPSDVILCDTIRRFKGLERPVIVLVELDGIDDPAILRRLLYVGASRARQHLVVIGSPAVLGVLRGKAAPNRSAAKVVEDPMPADATPADRWLAVEVDPLERRAAVRTGERPGHLEDARRGHDGLDPQPIRERGGRRRAKGIAGRVEVLDHDPSEGGPLAFRQAPEIPVEGRRGLVAHRLGRVDVGEERLRGVVARDLTPSDMVIHLALHALPALRPEPDLVGRDRDGGMQLDDAVGALDDLHLHPRLIEVEAASDVGRQGDQATPLDRHVRSVVTHEWQHSSIAVIQPSLEPEVIHAPTLPSTAYPGLIP